MPKIVDHAARRRELARAAWRIVGQHGLEGLTTRAVAREAGWSTGVLAHYFINRDELLLAAFRLVFDEAIDRIQRALTAEPDPMRALTDALLEAVPINPRQRTEAIVWFTFLGLAAGHPTLRAEAQTRYAQWLDIIEHAVQAAFSDQQGAKAEARHIARVLVSHVDGLTIQTIFDPEGLPTQQLAMQLRECIHTTLSDAARRLTAQPNVGELAVDRDAVHTPHRTDPHL